VAYSPPPPPPPAGGRGSVGRSQLPFPKPVAVPVQPPPKRFRAVAKVDTLQSKYDAVFDQIIGCKGDIAKEKAKVEEKEKLSQLAAGREPLKPPAESEDALVQLTAAEQEEAKKIADSLVEQWNKDHDGLTEDEIAEQKPTFEQFLETAKKQLQDEQVGAEKRKEEIAAVRQDIIAEYERRRTTARQKEEDQLVELAGVKAGAELEIAIVKVAQEEDKKGLEAPLEEAKEEMKQAEEELKKTQAELKEASLRRERETNEVQGEVRKLEAKVRTLASLPSGVALKSEVDRLQVELKAKEEELASLNTSLEELRQEQPPEKPAGAGTTPRVVAVGAGRGGVPAGRGAPAPSQVITKMPPPGAVPKAANPSGFSVGERVDAQYGAEWHPATIRAINGDKCAVDWDAEATYTAGLDIKTQIRKKGA